MHFSGVAGPLSEPEYMAVTATIATTADAKATGVDYKPS
jgi:hypothetical protein